MLQGRELFDDPHERLEFHEGGRPVRRTVLTELNGAHLAAQVALPNGFKLQILR
jgi:hypothetical protein